MIKTSKLSKKQALYLIYKLYMKYNNSFTIYDIKQECKLRYNIYLNISDVDYLLLNNKLLYCVYESGTLKQFNYDTYSGNYRFNFTIIALIIYKLFYFNKIKKECIAENLFK